MLENHLRLVLLQQVMLLLLNVQCLYQQVPGPGEHLLRTIRELFFFDVLARTWQPYDFVASLRGHFELVILLDFDHLHVLDDDLAEFLYHVAQVFLLGCIVGVRYGV